MQTDKTCHLIYSSCDLDGLKNASDDTDSNLEAYISWTPELSCMTVFVQDAIPPRTMHFWCKLDATRALRMHLKLLVVISKRFSRKQCTTKKRSWHLGGVLFSGKIRFRMTPRVISCILEANLSSSSPDQCIRWLYSNFEFLKLCYNFFFVSQQCAKINKITNKILNANW